MRTARSSLWAAALLAGACAYAQDDFSRVEIQTLPVADGLYMLVGSGGNIALSTGADGAFIVDTEFAPLTDKIQAAVIAAGGGPIEFIVNTHWHGDHTGGNENFANAGATIMAHDNVRARLSAPQVNTMNGETLQPPPAAAIPVVTYPNRMTFHWNGGTVNVIHAPNAHTDSDSIVHFTNANAFHMGDCFVNGGFPFVDVNSMGSLEGIIAAAKEVLSRSDSATKIIPGHGPLATPAELRTWMEALETIQARIEALVDQSRSEDQVVAADPTAEWNATLGAGFMNGETLTRFAYRAMTR